MDGVFLIRGELDRKMRVRFNLERRARFRVGAWTRTQFIVGVWTSLSIATRVEADRQATARFKVVARTVTGRERRERSIRRGTGRGRVGCR